MAKQSKTFYKRLAYCLAEKGEHPYSSTLSWLRCLLSFIPPEKAEICHPIYQKCMLLLWPRFQVPPSQLTWSALKHTYHQHINIITMFLLFIYLLTQKKMHEKSVCVWHIMSVWFHWIHIVSLVPRPPPFYLFCLLSV